MPRSLHAWYSLYDLDALAERGAILNGELEPGKLVRLRENLYSDRGSIQAELKFQQSASRAITVDLTYTAVLEQVCQRCLEPVELTVSEQVSLVLLEREPLQTDNEYEVVILTDGKLRPSTLIEDELIVSMPIIPRHADISECGPIVQDLQILVSEESDGS